MLALLLFFTSHLYSYAPPHLVGDLKALEEKASGTLVKSSRSVSEIFLAQRRSSPFSPLLPIFQTLPFKGCFREYVLWFCTHQQNGSLFRIDRVERNTAFIKPQPPSTCSFIFFTVHGQRSSDFSSILYQIHVKMSERFLFQCSLSQSMSNKFANVPGALEHLRRSSFIWILEDVDSWQVFSKF